MGSEMCIRDRNTTAAGNLLAPSTLIEPARATSLFILFFFFFGRLSLPLLPIRRPVPSFTGVVVVFLFWYIGGIFARFFVLFKRTPASESVSESDEVAFELFWLLLFVLLLSLSEHSPSLDEGAIWVFCTGSNIGTLHTGTRVWCGVGCCYWAIVRRTPQQFPIFLYFCEFLVEKTPTHTHTHTHTHIHTHTYRGLECNRLFVPFLVYLLLLRKIVPRFRTVD